MTVIKITKSFLVEVKAPALNPEIEAFAVHTLSAAIATATQQAGHRFLGGGSFEVAVCKPPVPKQRKKKGQP